MNSSSINPPAKRYVITGIAFFVIFVVVLLNLPVSSFLDQLQENELARLLLSRKKLVLVAGGLFVLAAAGWLLAKRKFALLIACAGAGLLAVTTYGIYKFQQQYPRADLFSIERLGDNFSILLGKDVLLSDFDPKSTLVLDNKAVSRAAFPAIDVHFHLESLPSSITPERLVQAMDEAGIAKVVNLGGSPGMFEHFAETFYAKYPDRFIMFVKPDPGALGRKNGAAEDLERIKKAVRMGARGLKENKSFGMSQLDEAGNIVPVDDSRLDPLWELAGKLGMPVLIHTGEPPSFWDPVDAHNERYPELLKHPEWSLHGKKVPSRQELREQRERLLARHPNTNFIGAHFGMDPENLDAVAHLLDTYPNYYVDMSSVVQELGREPYSARRFFIKYQDRILFGTDGGYGLSANGDGWTTERMYRSYFEFLETENEYIGYPLQDITKQGNWRVYGLNLPPEVLEKIYTLNAERLIPPEIVIKTRLESLAL